MTEYEIKEICKSLIENCCRKLRKVEKELLKYFIDESHDLNELMWVLSESLLIDRNRY